MALREFNAGKNRAQRAQAVITIPDLHDIEHKFRRKRMTGQRFREILEQEPTTVAGDERPDEELTASELAQRGRARALQGTENVYEQIAQLIEPIDPDSLALGPPESQRPYSEIPEEEQETELKEWLVINLDWDDAPALLNWLDDLKPKSGNAAA